MMIAVDKDAGLLNTMASGDQVYRPKRDVLYLFDVDGTLTLPLNDIAPSFLNLLLQLQQTCGVALVGGSDIIKITKQMGGSEQVKKFDYVFSENGLVAFKNGELIHKESVLKFLGEEKLQKFINFVLRYLSEIELPCKRGTFIEFRNGMLNISPIGRSCSQAERDAFFEYDKTSGVRRKMVQVLQEKFGKEYQLQFAIGGQISLDVYPVGWNKCYCLRFVEHEYKTIHFFGDKTSPGGNDHEIFEDSRTIGHTVQSPADTEKQLRDLTGMQLPNAATADAEAVYLVS